MKKHYFFSLLMTAGAHVALAQSPDLEAYISFNGSTTAINAGNVLSVSTAGINSGAVLTTDRNGNPNSAVNLNGSAFIDFGDHPNFRFGMDDFTLMFWMYGDATQTGQGIPVGKRGFSGGQDFAYMFGWTAGTQQAMAYYRDNEGNANNWPTVSVPSGQWHHLAMVFDRAAGFMFVYLDGVQTSSADIFDLAGFDATGSSAGQLMVGRSSQGGQFFKGAVDELYLFRGALNQSEINWGMNGFPCIVNIPDPNFKAALVNNFAINTNGDGEIQCDEAAAFSGTMNVANQGIADLTGIEAFTEMTQLFCANNQLTSVDVSANTALTLLSFNDNQLASLDVSNNTALTSLTCNNNQLTSLDVSNNAALTSLWLNQNLLTSLDLSSNPALSVLLCGFNSLTALDLSNNSNLTNLSCGWNQLTDLQLGNLSALSNIEVYGNQLTQLDLTANPAITSIFCGFMGTLQILRLSNGNNGIITTVHAQSSPQLFCIEVDNPTFSSANWTGSNFQFDMHVSFGWECLTVGIEETQGNSLTAYPNPTSDILQFSQPASGHLFDLSSRNLMTFGNVRSIDLSGLASGSYVVRTVDGDVMRVVRE
jgi:Leucine-rich repeat (LRR) protein